MTFLLILLIIIILYVLSVRGRKNQPGWAQLDGWLYAHRGLFDQEKPENSMAAFRAALDAGFGIELDVHLTKDGTLAVIHDSLLARTTGAEGRVEDLCREQLADYRLEGTQETIPTLSQVLELFAGKAPMIIELKVHGDNYAELCRAVCRQLESYNGPYCIESFDPRCILWLKKNHPQILRGLLCQDYFRYTKNNLPLPLKIALTFQMLNFLICPDFVAYRYAHSKNISNWVVRNSWGVRGVAWTLRNRQELSAALGQGWLPIFEP